MCSPRQAYVRKLHRQQLPMVGLYDAREGVLDQRHL